MRAVPAAAVLSALQNSVRSSVAPVLLRVLVRGDLHTFGVTPVLLRGLAR